LHHLKTGLEKISILGIETNLNFLQEIVRDERFTSNDLSTQYCDSRLDILVGRILQRKRETDPLIFISGFLAGTLLSDRHGDPELDPADPWHVTGYWRHGPVFRFSRDGEDLSVHLEPAGQGSLRFNFRGISREITSVHSDHGEVSFLLDGEPGNVIYARMPRGEEFVVHRGIRVSFKRWDSLPDLPAVTVRSDRIEHADSAIVSPMHGKVVKVHVKEKSTVKPGDVMVTIDSMKIENNILAPRKARVLKIMVEPGMQVEVNKTLLTIE
jgi:acetyl/propionyl-CoA carboxylase alpha subunit